MPASITIVTQALVQASLWLWQILWRYPPNHLLGFSYNMLVVDWEMDLEPRKAGEYIFHR